MGEKSITSALGLENLKDFQETLKQYNEAQQALKEFNEQFGKLKSENSPIAQAIQRRFDAGTLKDLTEGDKTALEQLKAKVEEENRQVKEVNTALVDENRQLKEVLQTKTTQEIIREEFDRRFPTGGNPGSDDSLTKAIHNLVAERLNALVGGDLAGAKGSTLTNEGVRQIVSEEVTKVTQGNNSPDQAADNIVKMLTLGDTVRQKLGLGEGGSRYLPQAGSLRSDVLRLLMEDERERVKIDHDHEDRMERNKHLGTLAGAVKENIEDFVGAARDTVKEHRESRLETGESKEGNESAGFAVKCSLCNEVSVLPDKPTDIFECPKCHGKLKIEERGGGQESLSEQKPPQTPRGSVLEI